MPEWSGRWRLAFLLALLAAATLDYWFLTQNALNRDVGALMSLAERLLDGLPLNDPLAPREPPLSLFVYALPVLLHRLLPGLDLTAASFVFTFGLIVLSTLLCGRIAKDAAIWPDEAARRSGLLFLLGGFCLLPLTLQWHVFSQREHLSVLLCAPYYFAMMRRLKGDRPGWRIDLAVGLLAAPGFSLKPLLALLFIATEALLLLRQRRLLAWLRIDSLVIGGVGLAYLLLWPKLYPAYFSDVDRYAETVLSAAAIRGLVPQLCFLVAMGSLLSLYVMAFQRRRDVWPLGLLLLVFLGATGLFILQTRTFPQQFFLPCFFLVMATALVAGQRRRRRDLILALALFLAFDPTRFVMRTVHGGAARDLNTVADILRPYVKDKPVTPLSMTVFPAWPLITLSDARFDAPLRNIFALNRVLQREGRIDVPLSKFRDEERYFVALTARHLVERKPEWVMVVNWTGVGTDRKIDALASLRQDPAFAAAWASYVPVIDGEATPSIYGVFYVSLYHRLPADDAPAPIPARVP